MHCSRLRPSLRRDRPTGSSALRAPSTIGGDDLAGDDAVADVERVGVQVIDAEALLQHAAEEREAARENRGLVAEPPQRRDQPLGAVGERDPLDHLLQRRFGQSLQQRDAPAERLLEIELAAHGALR